MEVRDLGRMEYGECLALQHQLRDALQAGTGEDTILVVEHPMVATLGRRGTPDDVFDKTLPVYEIERGGKATLHGPGQLVVYPIVHLGEGNRDVRAWVRHLERFLIDCLAHFGIDAESDPAYPGVWTTGSHKKIASIGIAVQGWVSFHGVALNVSLEPKEFERIDPCGLGAAVMTNMVREGAAAEGTAAGGAGADGARSEGSPVDLDSVKAWVMANAGRHFKSFRIERMVREN